MKILLVGGGSGGHAFPLVAVSRKLKQISNTRGYGQSEFLFIGPDQYSRSIFKNEEIPTRAIIAGKIRRYFSPANFLDILIIPISVIQAYWYIFWFMPDVIFAKGGYGSVPSVLVGWLFRIPIILHESDTIPGLANKLLAVFSKKIIVSFSDTARFFSSRKTMVLGNPIRENLFSIVPENPREVIKIKSEKPVIFIIGGSQGAKQINDLVILALPEFLKRYEIIHQCGEQNYEDLKKEAFLEIKNKEDRELYHLYAALDEIEMASVYNIASVIVSRAGSGAIFEISASGKPSVLIPYANAAGDHQVKNAEVYAGSGAAIALGDRNLMPHMILSEVDYIIDNPKKAKSMSKAAKLFAKPDAAQKIAEEIFKVLI
jgi:UDP-N-acetylglucosamine--N-acetylmuramyl-(pentapeptide) pyrophosphoryl-undecaprenol N-acetylglucosamine transferase